MGTSNMCTPNEILNELLTLLNVVRIVGNWDSQPKARTLSLADGQMKVACLQLRTGERP